MLTITTVWAVFIGPWVSNPVEEKRQRYLLFLGGKEQDAFTCFMQAVKLNPLFGSAFTYLGHYYRTVKNDPIRAKKCYQKAFVLEASDVDAALHLSDYYVADGEMTEAEDIFEKVTELCPKCAWAWRRLGFAKMV